MMRLLSRLFFRGERHIHIHLHIDKPITIINSQSIRPYNSSNIHDTQQREDNQTANRDEHIVVDDIDVPEVEFGQDS